MRSRSFPYVRIGRRPSGLTPAGNRRTDPIATNDSGGHVSIRYPAGAYRTGRTTAPASIVATPLQDP